MPKSVKDWIIEAKKKDANLSRFSFKTLAQEIELSVDEINREAMGYVSKGYLLELYEVRCPKCQKTINEFTSYPEIPSEHVCHNCNKKVQLRGNVYSHFMLPSSKGE